MHLHRVRKYNTSQEVCKVVSYDMYHMIQHMLRSRVHRWTKYHGHGHQTMLSSYAQEYVLVLLLLLLLGVANARL